MTLRDGDGGRLLAHCKKSDCDFEDILSAGGVIRKSDYSSPVPFLKGSTAAKKQKSDLARRCWNEAKPIGATPAEVYLRSRAITCDLPDTLRFHPACWHSPTRNRLPAMLARIDGGDGFSIHRTYLEPDGSKTNVQPARMMLGSMSGGVVRLSGGHSRLVVAEGIETSLSLLCGLLSDPANVWACLSTWGLKALTLPLEFSQLIIASDGDEAGERAAYQLAERAAVLGWQVCLLPAPKGYDWNDFLQGRAE